MAYSIRCADLGGECPATFVAASQEELLEHMELHAHRAHPAMPWDDATRVMIRAQVRLA